ncbi:hypothetical protein NXW89_19255 [Bacteroides thetaiotaomicron]|nr:hypothetical protein [Bacteroides thetaiotaomicron]
MAAGVAIYQLAKKTEQASAAMKAHQEVVKKVNGRIFQPGSKNKNYL